MRDTGLFRFFETLTIAHTIRAEASSILPASALMPSTHLIQLKIRPTDLPPILSLIFPLTFAFICLWLQVHEFLLVQTTYHVLEVL